MHHIAMLNDKVVEAAESFVQSIGEDVTEQILKNSPSFEEQPKEIPQNNAMEADKKIEVINKLSQDATKPAEPKKCSKESQTKDFETTQAATQQTTVPANKADVDTLEVDPLGEVVKAIFIAALTAVSTDEDKESKIQEEKAQLTAQYAALIRQQAKQEATLEIKNYLKNLAEAARNVRNLCGELDPFSFDSASDIYRYALKSTGRNVSTNDLSALKEMVSMATDAKIVFIKNNISPSLREGNFKHLRKITFQQ